MKQSAYEILNISPQSGYKVIRRAYKTMLREFPPEKSPEKFSKIREAFEFLAQTEANRNIDNFPIYLDFVRQVDVNQEDQPQTNETTEAASEFLSQVFETPFNTLFDLTTLFENDKGTT